MKITSDTTWDDLVGEINRLEDELTDAEDVIRDLRHEVADLSITHTQRDRLEEAADLMAELGRIHNTPYAKREWVEGY